MFTYDVEGLKGVASDIRWGKAELDRKINEMYEITNNFDETAWSGSAYKAFKDELEGKKVSFITGPGGLDERLDKQASHFDEAAVIGQSNITGNTELFQSSGH